MSDATETPVNSPCISVCALNEDNQCVGCFRTVEEITQWVRMDRARRLAVLEKCRQRAKRNNPFA